MNPDHFRPVPMLLASPCVSYVYIYIYKLYMISKVFKAIFCGVLQSLMVRKEEADKVRATP